MADPAFDIISAGSGDSPVAAGGTITFQYPPARGPVTYAWQGPAYFGVRGAQAVYTEGPGVSVAYGSSNITVTLGANVPTIPANTPVSLQAPLRDTSGAPSTAQFGTAAPAAEATDYNYR